MSTSLRPRRIRFPVRTTREDSLKLRATVVSLLLFVGIGGVFGGLDMIRHPLSPLGMTPALIAGSPFDTYTWPGILLLVLVGLTPCALAAGLIARTPGALELSGLFGLGLMAWIGVQWALLADRLWLQPVIFGIGAVVCALAAYGARRMPR
jgi:hypothetical protein